MKDLKSIIAGCFLSSLTLGLNAQIPFEKITVQEKNDQILAAGYEKNNDRCAKSFIQIKNSDSQKSYVTYTYTDDNNARYEIIHINGQPKTVNYYLEHRGMLPGEETCRFRLRRPLKLILKMEKRKISLKNSKKE